MHSKPCCLLYFLLGTIMLVGCDRSGDMQARDAVPAPAASASQAPAELAAEEVAPVSEPVTGLDEARDTDIREIEWEALIPEDWRPEVLMDQYNVDGISDDDPRAQGLLDKLKALWNEAPVVSALEGQRVKLPGFVVPLEMEAKKIEQFLLVPYYGACIHVPPPPANQTVHVVTGEGEAFEGGLFDTVWVTGTMRVERLSSDLADAGYRLENASVAPYE